MRKTKWEFLDIHLFEASVLANHFEDMANKGWMLQKMTASYLVYEVCEPQSVSFHINLFAKGSLISPQYVGEELNRYIDLVCEYGYEQICGYSYFQVFISHQTHTFPIDSDDFLSQKAYRKATIKYEMTYYGIYAILWGLLALLGRSGFSLYTLQYPTSLILPVEWLVFSILWCFRLLPFLRWLIKGKNYQTSIAKIKHRSIIFYSTATCLFILLLIILFGFDTNVSIILFTLCIFTPILIATYFALDKIARHFVKKYHRVVSLILIMYLMFFMMNSIFLSNLSKHTNDPVLSYSEAEMMVFKEAFEIKADDRLSAHRSSNPLANIDEFSGGYHNQDSYFRYYNITLKIDFLHDMIIQQLISDSDSPLISTQAFNGATWYHYETQDILVRENRILVLESTQLTQPDLEALLNLFMI